MATPQPKLPTVGGVPHLPALPPWLAFTQGDIWHVKPVTGLDTNSGKSPRSAFKTLSAALDAATANQNDIILYYPEGNASALATDYQSATLDWNKDMVHLIGVTSGVSMSPRARIAFVSTYATASNLFTLSANGCYIANIAFYAGVADTRPTGCVKVTGSRNRFDRCHIVGMGAATNDIAGAYSLLLEGAEECEFHECTIGTDRTALGAAANSQIKCASVAKNILFKDCRVKLVSTHATNHVFLRAASGSLDGAIEFSATRGVNSQSRNVAGVELTYAMVVAADAGGDINIDATSNFQATDVNSTDTGNVYAATAASGISVPAVK